MKTIAGFEKEHDNTDFCFLFRWDVGSLREGVSVRPSRLFRERLLDGRTEFLVSLFISPRPKTIIFKKRHTRLRSGSE